MANRRTPQEGGRGAPGPGRVLIISLQRSILLLANIGMPWLFFWPL